MSRSAGDTAIVAAAEYDDLDEYLGSVYVFREMDGAWVQAAELTAADGAPDDVFGCSVSISGDTAIIGAFGDDDLGTHAGSAYIFREINGAWVQIAKLTATDGDAFDIFGASVSISGDTAVVGAWRDDKRHDIRIRLGVHLPRD